MAQAMLGMVDICSICYPVILGFFIIWQGQLGGKEKDATFLVWWLTQKKYVRGVIRLSAFKNKSIKVLFDFSCMSMLLWFLYVQYHIMLSAFSGIPSFWGK